MLGKIICREAGEGAESNFGVQLGQLNLKIRWLGLGNKRDKEETEHSSKQISQNLVKREM